MCVLKKCCGLSSALNGPVGVTDFFLRRFRGLHQEAMGPEFNEQNPNLQDLPPSQPEGGPVSREVGSDLQQ